MGTEFWHFEVFEKDLNMLNDEVSNFDEFLTCLIAGISQAKNNPYRPGWALDYALEGWQEYKFFSKEIPEVTEKPDMRFVYRYNWDFRNIYILAVGRRNSKETRTTDNQDSIYFTASERLLQTTKYDWIIVSDY
ncbi:MAG: hypothetical protein LRY73_09620 [Bacillus sp. (in: Bacteria)]|nr:hypothetical protein [Bacillus sp. (in: firmicutes)]